MLESLNQDMTIRLPPRVHSWGLTAERPRQLITDFVEGTLLLLSTVLKQENENEDEELVLNPDIEDAVVDKI